MPKIWASRGSPGMPADRNFMKYVSAAMMP